MSAGDGGAGGGGTFDPVVKIKRERAQVAVVVLGRAVAAGHRGGVRGGASGYVRHDERIEGVERAIMKARAGEGRRGAAVAAGGVRGAAESCGAAG
ncbi:hypothetical protein GCM10023238_31410 [Streptomyces heliomycini]